MFGDMSILAVSDIVTTQHEFQKYSQLHKLEIVTSIITKQEKHGPPINDLNAWYPSRL